ncbi:MAG: hypothetical protein PHI11_08330 [Gallionella sp.]|nr:hypothetical protein [Gallionella sp.]
MSTCAELPVQQGYQLAVWDAVQKMSSVKAQILCLIDSVKLPL